MLKKTIFCLVATLVMVAGWILPGQASSISLDLTGTAFGIQVNGVVPQLDKLTAVVQGQITDLYGNPITDVTRSAQNSAWVEYNGPGTMLEYMQSAASQEMGSNNTYSLEAHLIGQSINAPNAGGSVYQIAGAILTLSGVYAQSGYNFAKALGDITYQFQLNQDGGTPFVYVGFDIWIEGTAYMDGGSYSMSFWKELYYAEYGSPSSSQLLISFNTGDQKITPDFFETLNLNADGTLRIEGGIYVGQFGQTASSVPIPSSLFLLGTGFLSLGAMVWRRRKL